MEDHQVNIEFSYTVIKIILFDNDPHNLCLLSTDNKRFRPVVLWHCYSLNQI